MTKELTALTPSSTMKVKVVAPLERKYCGSMDLLSSLSIYQQVSEDDTLVADNSSGIIVGMDPFDSYVAASIRLRTLLRRHHRQA